MRYTALLMQIERRAFHWLLQIFQSFFSNLHNVQTIQNGQMKNSTDHEHDHLNDSGKQKIVWIVLFPSMSPIYLFGICDFQPEVTEKLSSHRVAL